ncbi:type II secretion system protein GspM [Phenylobacterium sp.]|jgi:general secretion pathway protein M|uniref:type II secretion system protein GspM n=1 Tax=Phenylobacterium sp. TaxID=1871053 RepID=UPI003783EECF
MRAWFESKTPREKVLLAVMAAALLAFALWFGLFRPLAQARAGAERRFELAAREAAAVQAASARLKSLPRPAQGRAADPARAVSETAAAEGLNLSRVEPDPAGGVQVAVNAVAPMRLFPWLASLQADHGVTPRHLTVIKDEQGTLSVDATFGGGD